jgi:hypothetical protein
MAEGHKVPPPASKSVTGGTGGTTPWKEEALVLPMKSVGPDASSVTAQTLDQSFRPSAVCATSLAKVPIMVNLEFVLMSFVVLTMV